jgi:stage II sporulation protein M
VLIQAKRRVLADLLDNKGQYLLLTFFLVVGITAGTFTVSNMQDGSKEALRSYVSAVFLSVQTSSVDFMKVFFHALLQDTLIFGFLALCSLMVLGIPLIALVMAAKGFLVGFTVGVLALNLGAGGFLAIVLCIFLSNLVLIPCTLKAGVLGLGNAIDVFKARHIPKTPTDKLMMSRPFFKRILAVYAVSLVGVLIESLLVPLLIKTI